MTNPDTIIFLHIPKTAGTTINSILQQQYESKQIYFLGLNAQESIQSYQQLAAEEKKAIRLVSGHTSYGFHKYIPGSSTYFTFLRDPVERVISFYHFVKKHDQHYLHRSITKEVTGIIPFVSNRWNIMVDNGQTRLISGAWLEPGSGKLTSQTFELAKKNLSQNFSVVGLTEHFDLTLLLFRKIFNWQNINYVRKNVSKAAPHERRLTPEERETILNYNQWDVALYEYAKERFEQQIAALGPDYSRQLEIFQRQNFRFQNLNTPWQRRLQRARRFSVRTSIRRMFSR